MSSFPGKQKKGTNSFGDNFIQKALSALQSFANTSPFEKTSYERNEKLNKNKRKDKDRKLSKGIKNNRKSTNEDSSSPSSDDELRERIIIQRTIKRPSDQYRKSKNDDLRQKLFAQRTKKGHSHDHRKFPKVDDNCSSTSSDDDNNLRQRLIVQQAIKRPSKDSNLSQRTPIIPSRKIVTENQNASSSLQNGQNSSRDYDNLYYQYENLIREQAEVNNFDEYSFYSEQGTRINPHDNYHNYETSQSKFSHSTAQHPAIVESESEVESIYSTETQSMAEDDRDFEEEMQEKGLNLDSNSSNKNKRRRKSSKVTAKKKMKKSHVSRKCLSKPMYFNEIDSDTESEKYLQDSLEAFLNSNSPPENPETIWKRKTKEIGQKQPTYCSSSINSSNVNQSEKVTFRNSKISKNASKQNKVNIYKLSSSSSDSDSSDSEIAAPRLPHQVAISKQNINIPKKQLDSLSSNSDTGFQAPCHSRNAIQQQQSILPRRSSLTSTNSRGSERPLPIYSPLRRSLRSNKTKESVISKITTKTTTRRDISIDRTKTEHLIFPQCKTCKQFFVTKDQLSKHEIKTHQDIKPVPSLPTPLNRTCYFCDEKFKRKFLLDLHLNSKHTMEKAFKCKTCGKEFVENWLLMRHKKNSKHFSRNIGQPEIQPAKGFKCPKCNKILKLKKNSQRHLRTHLPNKHKCIVCKKLFSEKGYLKVHMSMHTATKPFPCPNKKCDKSYLKSSDLSDHIESVHGRQNKF